MLAQASGHQSLGQERAEGEEGDPECSEDDVVRGELRQLSRSPEMVWLEAALDAEA